MPLSDAEIYQRDSDFCRYQDGLRWSRFQTAAIVEGAVFYGVWAYNLGRITETLIALGGFILVVVISILSQYDERDKDTHLERIKKFEEANSSIPYESLPVKRVPKFIQDNLRGGDLVPIAWLVLYAFNLLALVAAVVGSNF